MSKTRDKTSLPIAFTRFSPNCTNPSNSPKTRLTPHHMAGNITIEVCMGMSKVTNPNPTGGMSMNYAIGTDGRRGLCVEENKRAWTSSCGHNDHRAITFEIANNGGTPNWTISDSALEAFIAQAVETCKFYGFKRVIFIEPVKGQSKTDGKTAEQVSLWLETQRPADAMLITLHRFFSATSCPGPYFESKLPGIITEINRRLADEPPKSSNAKKTNEEIAAEVWKGLWGNGQDRINRLKAAGYDPSAVQKIVDATNPNKKSQKSEEFKEYRIRITVAALNIRRGPSINQPVVKTLMDDKNVYTIVAESDGWGKLKSGVGWIALNYTRKV